MPASRQEVDRFLEEFKKAAQEGLTFVNRDVNNTFLLKHGMTPDERKGVILGLRVEDYVAGPQADIDPKHPGPVWNFGADYLSVRVYIKLKLVTDKEGKKMAKGISFHEAEALMQFPHR